MAIADADGGSRRARRARPPLDPRLLRYSPATRRYVLVTALLAAITTVAVIVTAVMTASILAELVTEPARRSLTAQSVHLWVLAAAVVVRVLTSFGHDRYAHRASATAIAELRARALDVLTDPDRTPPRELVQRREHATTVLLRGLGALGPYLSGYVPALIVTVLVTPTVLAVIAVADWPSAVIIVITLPLIPLFMILIGLMTRDRTERKLATMSRLSAQLLDLVTGLPTLRALNRARAPARQVADLGQAHRRSSMSSLRVAFLSGGVLEFLATISVALVAVGIGLRLVSGEMTLYAGVLALILAPEAYLPLRQVGAQFHNSVDGVTAAGEVLDLIDSGSAGAGVGRTRSCTVAGEPIRLLDVGVHGRDGWAPYELTATANPGELTVFTGPNGSGKSTMFAAILGLLAPDEGSVLVGSIPVAELEPDAYHEQVAWLPQQPVVVPGTVADNLALFGALDPAQLHRACAATGFDEVLASLPDGADTVLGTGGVGLSAGQRQRLALTRVLASPSPLLLLDEPTAHLDAASEESVLAALAARARAGDTVLVVAHRDVARANADHVVELPEVLGVR
ncbi:ABC transporter permease/ATP-binding protein CydD [Gordonia polyisoprenivorans NBRC 16320 = JCM 10675]|uniref:thiol reductant ABC exporter subunit CydD n=1 Tax=Gordonia polyisoprenivorans TaxID=84595 RepID=UPI00023A8185|nr:thiol reductant ABC exporter subunit CydD [Gordonia polyisoprenivorans]GAB21550.1 ABC transporter permease/ATP-binding protein CydD [Gordonia polyisoprenivorans NBRC 16320 = JCM 10675]